MPAHHIHIRALIFYIIVGPTTRFWKEWRSLRCLDFLDAFLRVRVGAGAFVVVVTTELPSPIPLDDSRVRCPRNAKASAESENPAIDATLISPTL